MAKSYLTFLRASGGDDDEENDVMVDIENTRNTIPRGFHIFIMVASGLHVAYKWYR